MKTLKEILQNAARYHWATGHFNASEFDQMRAIAEACREVGAPAIIGTSEGERNHLGLKEAVALKNVLEKEYGLPVFLNADHSKSAQTAKAAIEAGYDSVHIDLSILPYEKNLSGTKEVVEYAREHEFKIQNSKFKISVEGELGYLKGESKIEKEKIKVSSEDYTKPEEAAKFAEKTGIDRLAIVVGNIHGISLDEPALDIERIRKIRAALPQEVALVLHAGSSVPDDQIKAAIEAGIANIHINTDLRVAFVKELRKSLAEHLDEVAMYKIDAAAIETMKNVVKEKLILFGSVNRI